MSARWIRDFGDLTLNDVPLVGGKNASLGEMVRELSPAGVTVPAGFAVTADGYRHFLDKTQLWPQIEKLLSDINGGPVENLIGRSNQIKALMNAAELPVDLQTEILYAYHNLSHKYGTQAVDVAVRSSATAEDLPNASFAGQQESFLNVQGEEALLTSVKNCFASLFTPRAINYRREMGFSDRQVALSVGVQKMVRADLGASGVIFTLDTETGHPDFVLVNSIWGLGENIVQGRVMPDQFYVHKPTLKLGFRPLVGKQLGTKELRMAYDTTGHRMVSNMAASEEDRQRFSLSDDDALTLAAWAMTIEQHYSRRNGRWTPLDLEWAKDGRDGRLYIVQARPETVHSRAAKHAAIRRYELTTAAPAIVKGLAVGNAIRHGQARVIDSPAKIGEFRAGEILVTQSTDPDWEPIMKSAAAIVTDHGGRTSHAAIVARELGIPALVGTGNATQIIKTGAWITVASTPAGDGSVYEGKVPFETFDIDLEHLPRPKTKLMMNVGNPSQALAHSRLPNDGVGLARMEFILASSVRVHPLAVLNPEKLPSDVRRQVEGLVRNFADPREYYVENLALGIGMLAAAFWPRPVILRFSDFKTNEYRSMLGGEGFEPLEENPMIGWRGASRYYHPDFKSAFLLEVQAVRRVREVFGLQNLKVMVPFCRTPDEGRAVLAVMKEGGLERGRLDLQIYVMAEIPSNIWLAEAFAEVFDGFSIGSNDLTQLTLGIDRDSERVAPLFDERNEAVKQSCVYLIERAHRHGKPVGICGQAPSDYPEFGRFLVEQGIDSLSLSPEVLPDNFVSIFKVEQSLGRG